MIRLRVSLPVCLVVLAPALLRAAADVSFADLAAGQAVIAADAAYFDRLQPMEMEAKTGRPMEATTLEKQRAECRRRYLLAVMEFTPEEQAAIRQTVAYADVAVRRDYSRYSDVSWNFVKIAGNIEGGSPHTRGKHIVLPEPACRWVVNQVRSARGRSVGAIELLLHEKTHVFQRANPELFDSLYTGQWGFVRAKSIQTCPWIVEHQLVNPDAMDCPWVFPVRSENGSRYIWPLCSLDDGPGPKRMQDNFAMLAFDVVPDGDGFRVEHDGNGRSTYSDLLSVKEYCRVFGPSTNIYHPHEAAADLFARLVVYDAYRAKWYDAAHRAAQEKTFGPLRDWFRKNLGGAK